MQIERYIALRDRGLTRVTEAFGNCTIVIRRFDPATGDEVAPEKQDFTEESIDQQIAQYEKIIDNLKEMKSDIHKKVEAESTTPA